MKLFNTLFCQKSVALLIDPDKTVVDELLINAINRAKPDIILVGGSQRFSFEKLNQVITSLKEHCLIPVFIFPGHIEQVHPNADGVLALSVIQAKSSRFILDSLLDLSDLDLPSDFQIIYTPYLILSNSGETSVEKILNDEFKQIESITEFKKYLFFLQLIQPPFIYLEAGSGSSSSVSSDYISELKQINNFAIVMVGGGIVNSAKAFDKWISGADCIVIGNKVEENLEFLIEICQARDNFNSDFELIL